ncbi:MAG: hypothetical protein JXL80_05415 [Planctomycetes bacterium]|nr:hypothetical protein [Planctomycetota bacterium]
MIAIDWGSNQMIAVCIAAGLVVAVAVAWLVLGRTVRTRVRTEREVRDDPDIHDWLVVFNWSRKILYVPTAMVSVLACLAMVMHDAGWLPAGVSKEMIGGVWFTIFFLNFLVEEFEISVKLVLIGALCLLVLFFWLHLLGWVGSFLRMFGRVSLAMSWQFFLLVVLIWTMTVLVSWLRGLFQYVVFTPNYMNIQWGPSESGSHIGREDYNTHIDTEDILERLMGFGRIVIVFKDQKRPPMTFLVWRIARRAELLERVRGKFAFDLNAQPGSTASSRPGAMATAGRARSPESPGSDAPPTGSPPAGQ